MNRCGTPLGYRDHVADRTPKCQPCRDAHAARRQQSRKSAYLHGPQRVDITGTRRRLQALAAIGWPLGEIADRLGTDPQTLRRLVTQKRCATSTRDKVRALYDELSMTVNGNRRTMTWAAKRGYSPPLAWNDEDLDDPNARPSRMVRPRPSEPLDDIAIERAMRGDRVHIRPAERAEAVRRLTAYGLSAAEIADRLGVTDRSVSRHRKAA